MRRHGDGLVPIMNAQPATVWMSLSSSTLPAIVEAFVLAVRERRLAAVRALDRAGRS